MSRDAAELLAAGNAAYGEGRFREAREFGMAAAAREPDNPWAYNLIGSACAQEMELEAATQAFATAVAKDASIAMSHINYAYTLILAGKFDLAESELETAIRLEPENAGAYYNLAWIRKAAPGDALITRLEALSARTEAPRETQIYCAFALGKLYDDVGEFDRAFAQFKKGNELHGVLYDVAGHQKLFQSIENIFDAAFFAARQGVGHGSDKPVFIIGMPRCGSSVLEDRLSRRKDVAALGERPELSRILGVISSNHPRRAQFPDWASELALPAFERSGRHYVETFEKKFPNARKFIDKNLLHFSFVGFIRAMTPNASIIHCRRNPIDTCLSCYFQNLQPTHRYKFDLRSLGAHYRLYSRLMDHWRGMFTDIVETTYEDFIINADAEFARIEKAIGLSPENASARSAVSAGRFIQTSSAYQARQPLHGASVARWKNYEKHIGPLIDALGDLAE